MITCTLLLLFV